MKSFLSAGTIGRSSKVVVTGGAGFIGATLTARLLRSQAFQEVIVLDRFRGPSDDPFDESYRYCAMRQLEKLASFSTTNLSFVPVDLCDDREMTVVAARYSLRGSLVAHLAGAGNVLRSSLFPAEYISSNVASTHSVLTHLEPVGVVLASSCSVIGDGVLHQANTGAVSESVPPRPRSVYAYSKLMAEQALRESGVPSVALRLFNVSSSDAASGLGEWREYESHLIPCAVLAAAAYANEEPCEFLRVRGDGTTVRDYVAVTDVACAFERALMRVSGASDFSIYHIGSGSGSSINDVLAAVARVVGPVPITLCEASELEAPSLFCDPGKAKAELGWIPSSDSLLDNMILGTLKGLALKGVPCASSSGSFRRLESAPNFLVQCARQISVGEANIFQKADSSSVALKLHSVPGSPGGQLAAVHVKSMGAAHCTTDGVPSYEPCFQRTFGFYPCLERVQSQFDLRKCWRASAIRPDGTWSLVDREGTAIEVALPTSFKDGHVSFVGNGNGQVVPVRAVLQKTKKLAVSAVHTTGDYWPTVPIASRDTLAVGYYVHGDGSLATSAEYATELGNGTWCYVGDPREGVAVCIAGTGCHAGLSTHVVIEGDMSQRLPDSLALQHHRNGDLLHGVWYLEAGVFHKGFATARDSEGWFHVKPNGEAVYLARYASVEPFYNGVALVTLHGGRRQLINESGAVHQVLPPLPLAPSFESSLIKTLPTPKAVCGTNGPGDLDQQHYSAWNSQCAPCDRLLRIVLLRHGSRLDAHPCDHPYAVSASAPSIAAPLIEDLRVRFLQASPRSWDPPLSNVGAFDVLQWSVAASQFDQPFVAADFPPPFICSSPALRCLQTAALLSDAMAGRGAPPRINIIDRLQEEEKWVQRDLDASADDFSSLSEEATCNSPARWLTDAQLALWCPVLRMRDLHRCPPDPGSNFRDGASILAAIIKATPRNTRSVIAVSHCSSIQSVAALFGVSCELGPLDFIAVDVDRDKFRASSSLPPDGWSTLRVLQTRNNCRSDSPRQFIAALRTKRGLSYGDSTGYDISTDVTGVWKTSLLGAAVRAHIFDTLPGTLESVARGIEDIIESRKSSGGTSTVSRDGLLRVLCALGDIGYLSGHAEENGECHFVPTLKGMQLMSTPPSGLSMASAVLHFTSRDLVSPWLSLGADSPLFSSLTDDSTTHNRGPDFWKKRRCFAEVDHKMSAFYATMGYRDCFTAVSLLCKQQGLPLYSVLGTRGDISILDVGGGAGIAGLAFGRGAMDSGAVASAACHVVDMTAEAAAEVCQAEHSGLRPTFHNGDLFDPSSWPVLPVSLVILGRVLHDWDSASCVEILSSVRRYLKTTSSSSGFVVLLESIRVPPIPASDGERAFSNSLGDVHLGLLLSGAERTMEEYAELADRAGFRLIGTQSLFSGPVSVILLQLHN